MLVSAKSVQRSTIAPNAVSGGDRTVNPIAENYSLEIPARSDRPHQLHYQKCDRSDHLFDLLPWFKANSSLQNFPICTRPDIPVKVSVKNLVECLCQQRVYNEVRRRSPS